MTGTGRPAEPAGAQRPAGPLRVRGGPGGTRARLDDLDRAGVRLRAAADVMISVAAGTARTAADPLLALSAPYSPPTWAAVERRLARAVAPPCGALAVAARLVALGTAARGAGVGYRAADATADLTLHAVDAAVGRAVGTLVTVPVVASVVAAPLPALAVAAGLFSIAGVGDGVSGPGRLPDPTGTGDTLLTLLGGHTGLLEHAADGLPGAVGGAVAVVVPGFVPGLGAAAFVPPDLPGAAGWLGRAASVAGLLRETTGVTVTGRREVPVRPPAGLADIVAGIASLDPDRGTPAGTVRVIAVTGPGGRRAWVVQVPGTQTWSSRAGRNPLDLSGNVHVMAGEPTAGRHLVESAMRSAGVGPGEPVLLAGHSQGGIVAAQLAADPGFRAEFHVTHVVTAGSPVASVRVPDTVAVLSLEHDEDVVPRLDGDHNPDRAGWVTVSRSTTPEGGRPSPGVAHHLGSYARTAAAVDVDPDPGLARWRDDLRPFLAGPGVTATGVEVTGERVPPGAP
jgi:hypothetical protein